jgi:hypothetical protein
MFAFATITARNIRSFWVQTNSNPPVSAYKTRLESIILTKRKVVNEYLELHERLSCNYTIYATIRRGYSVYIVTYNYTFVDVILRQ